MNKTIRNILAVVGGWFGGGMINMLLVKLGHSIYPVEGVDMKNMEELAKVMPTLSTEHFVFPFLAHALGTLVGATIAAYLATAYKMKFALGIGVLFLIGGIVAIFMIPAPTWFFFVDLLFAYIPMAWMGGKIGLHLSKKK